MHLVTQAANQLRKSTIVQDYHPVVRRRAITSIRSSLPSYLTDFFENIKQQQYYEGLQKSQKIILDHFNKIHQIIDIVDDHIRRRIQCYENEVVNVVQKQIDQMREQTHNVVQQFNNMINQKNKETQIWALNNQLDYFKSQAKKLFDNNKKLRQENKQLKTLNQQYIWELENKEVVMQKIHMKYLKEKHYKNKLHKQITNSKAQIQTSQEQSKIQVAQYSRQLDKQIKKKSINLLKSTQNINEKVQGSFNINPIQIQNNKKQENENLCESIAMIKQFAGNFKIQHQTQSKLFELHQNSRIQVNFEDQESSFNVDNFRILSPQNKSHSICKKNILSHFNNNQSHNQEEIKEFKQIKKADYACQTNIYLSESSYREYFKKNMSGQKFNQNSPKIKKMAQIQVQTDNTFEINFPFLTYQQYIQQNCFTDQNQGRHKTLDNGKKQINFLKNGFFVNDVSQANKRATQMEKKQKSYSKLQKQRYDNGHRRQNFSSGNLFNNQARNKGNSQNAENNKFGKSISRNQNRSEVKNKFNGKNKNSTEMNYYKNQSPDSYYKSKEKQLNLNDININLVAQRQNPEKNQKNKRYIAKQKRQNTKMLMKFQNSKIRSRQFRNLASKSVLN